MSHIRISCYQLFGKRQPLSLSQQLNNYFTLTVWCNILINRLGQRVHIESWNETACALRALSAITLNDIVLSSVTYVKAPLSVSLSLSLSLLFARSSS
ncbi:hypothetical protein J6590_096613 [Homalodisca vitripennis]|nr:hypothetical protein J6590_096613 [Homalodisca vitripennis]